MADNGQVTPKEIWDEIEKVGGENAVRTAGIMGNWIAESNLNPEAAVQDSNGKMSYGLAQWNEGSYPNAASLVTGNRAKDMAAQVRFFFQTGGGKAATGSTPQQVASNVAANYERCQTCEAGGASNQQRQDNAGQVAGWAASDDWPSTSYNAAVTANLSSSAASEQSAECAWQIGSSSALFSLGPIKGPSLGPYCIFSKSQGRAILGTSILVGGILLGMFGISAIILTAIGENPAARRIVARGAEAGALLGFRVPTSDSAPRQPRVRTNRGSSPSGSAPPPARSTGTNTPPQSRRTGGPVSQQPPKRTGGRTQQGTQKKKGP